MEAMSVKVLGAVFDAMYESMFREEHNVRQTISYAFYDARAGVRGKADSKKTIRKKMLIIFAILLLRFVRI